MKQPSSIEVKDMLDELRGGNINSELCFDAANMIEQLRDNLLRRAVLAIGVQFIKFGIWLKNRK